MVTALIMNAALCSHGDTEFTNVKEHWVLPCLFNFFSMLSIFSGAFTTVVYTLLIIYSNNALGMGSETKYMHFRADTVSYRILGFRCFITSMASFVGQTLVRFGKDVKDGVLLEKLIFSFSILLTMYGAYHIKTLLALATKEIFFG